MSIKQPQQLEYSKHPKILFIPRAYPPVVGGIERQNFEVAKALSEITEVKIIANKKGKLFLPVFLPYALIKSLIIARNWVLKTSGFLRQYLMARNPKAGFVS